LQEFIVRHQRAEGAATLEVGPGGIIRLHQKAPLRLLFPTPEANETLQAVLVNTAGGLAGGDVLAARVAVATGAAPLVTTPAAEKVYGSLGPTSILHTRLEVGAGARLEYLPQEAILFDGARLDRRTEAHVAPGGVLLAVESLVLGRIARGEAWRAGAVREGWRLHLDGRLAWADALALDAAARDAPFALDGAEALGLMLLAAPDAARHRDLARELTGGQASLPCPGVLLLRFLGTASAVRRGLEAAIPPMRAAALGRPSTLPRLWTC
jgi:urease accessory protein